jgi:hypothetical protein
MDVIFDAADFVNKDARRFDASISNVLMSDGFDFRRKQWGVVLGVPNKMQVDFTVIIAGHLKLPVWNGENAKAKLREAP